ncbi:MAG: Chromosome segregation protein SMC [uncultured bacterium]|nr:MAG: Chromosome segregation protein SMC [uncultured bacterium]
MTIDSLHEKNTMLKVAIAEHEGKIESYQEHVFSKYQVRLLEIEKKESEVDTPWEEVPAKLEDLDQKIKSLGSVNLSAIEELAKLEDRFNFLTEQEKDLLAAKKQLVEVIEKINVTATQMFEDTFNKVKVYFNDIFGELFEGGKAELKLMDSPDMLEAGIDIVAKPGGKTFQTISLLSGGEKALTATALLFALFKVKPSPFCFIDELDAPLDDSNINRFTKLLKSFSDNTQFMVITHNKTTLKIADLLYGVTQPEKGISQLISVKFIDDDLDYLLKEPEVIKATKKGRVIEMKEDEDLSEYVIPEIKPVRFTLPEENAASVTAVSPEQKETITEPIPVRNSTEELLSSEESNALPEAIMERNTLVSIPEENS